MSITDMIVNKFTHNSDEDTAKHGTDYDPAENMDAVYTPPALAPLPSGLPPIQQFSIAAAFTPPKLPANGDLPAGTLDTNGIVHVAAPSRPNAADVIAASLVGTAQEAPPVAKLNASSDYGRMNNPLPTRAKADPMALDPMVIEPQNPPPAGLPEADHLAIFLNEYAAMKAELASLRQQVVNLQNALNEEQAQHATTQDALDTIHEAHQAEMTRHQGTIGTLNDEIDAHGETKATLEDMTSENTRMRVRLDWIMKLCDLNPDGATSQPLSPDDEAELSKVIAGLTRINK